MREDRRAVALSLRAISAVAVFGLVAVLTASVAQAATLGAPTALSATPGDTQMTLAWTAPALDGNPAISDYWVEHSTDLGASWTVFLHNVSAAASITVTGLVNGVSYAFRVAAVNSSGTGAWAEATATPNSTHTQAHTATYSACPAGAASSAGFSDVTLAAVDCIKYYGITKGTTATTFSPHDPVSRWQMALFLTRMAGPAGVVLGSGATQGFTDIGGESSEIQTAINQIKQLGITVGKTAITYDPAGFVTREEMALFLTRFLKKATVGPGGHTEYVTGYSGLKEIKSNDTDHNFLDMTGLSLYETAGAVANLWNLGVTDSSTSTVYEPLRNITRREMAIMMANALGHTNARPSGLWLQSDILRSAETTRLLSITHRTADFKPIVGSIVDVFKFTVAPTTTNVRFNATGPAAGQCSSTEVTSLGGVKCTIDSVDPKTDSDGNVTAFGEFMPSYSLVDYWAWTAATGTVYDNDVNASAASKITLETSAA